MFMTGAIKCPLVFVMSAFQVCKTEWHLMTTSTWMRCLWVSCHIYHRLVSPLCTSNKVFHLLLLLLLLFRYLFKLLPWFASKTVCVHSALTQFVDSQIAPNGSSATLQDPYASESPTGLCRCSKMASLNLLPGDILRQTNLSVLALWLYIISLYTQLIQDLSAEQTQIAGSGIIRGK